MQSLTEAFKAARPRTSRIDPQRGGVREMLVISHYRYIRYKLWKGMRKEKGFFKVQSTQIPDEGFFFFAERDV